MKTISAAALNALDAGEAVVMGAVEILPGLQPLGSITTFTEDFAGGLGGYSTYEGSSVGYTIVADTDLGQCLEAAPGHSAGAPGSGRDSIAKAIGDNPFSEITAEFKVMATDDDDYGVMDLLDVAGNVVLSFTPGRQTSIDALRRPNVTFWDQNGQPGNPIGAGAVTEEHVYQFHALYDGSSSFDITITDLTTSTTFGSISVPVSARTPISTLRFRTEYSAGSGTVRWDNIEIALDVVSEVADPIRVWAGYGTISLDTDSGPQTFQGIGARGLMQQIAGAIGGVAQGMMLSVSAVEEAALALLDASEIRAAAVVSRELVFDSTSITLLDNSVVDRGRVDTVATERVVGGDAVVNVAVESAARGLGRRGERTRSDFDQKLITGALNDRYFRNVPYAGEKFLYWNGKRPAIVGGSSSGGGGTTSGAIGGLNVSAR